MGFEIILDDISNTEWQESAREFADYSIYQTLPYQQVRADMAGQEVSKMLVRDPQGAVVLMGQVRIKRIKPLRLRVGYVQWGPLARGHDGRLCGNIEPVRLFLDSYLGNKVDILRIIPNARQGEVGDTYANILQEAGFEQCKRVKPYRTMFLSVDISEAEMQQRLHRSWRRYLKKAEKAGLEIKEGMDGEYFDVLEALYVQAKRRKGFEGLDPEEFLRPQSQLAEHEKMNIVVAYYKGEPVTAHATSHLGDAAVGTLAASNEKALECSASYLVWWRTLLAAKHAGMKWYDLGGIDSKKNPSVYQYKARMGAEEFPYIGAFEAYTSGLAKGVWAAGEQVYNLMRRK